MRGDFDHTILQIKHSPGVLLSTPEIAVLGALPTRCWSSVLPAPIGARCKAPLLLVGWPDPGSCVNCQSNTFITRFLFHRGKISALWCWFLCLHVFFLFYFIFMLLFNTVTRVQECLSSAGRWQRQPNQSADGTCARRSPQNARFVSMHSPRYINWKLQHSIKFLY